MGPVGVRNSFMGPVGVRNSFMGPVERGTGLWHVHKLLLLVYQLIPTLLSSAQQAISLEIELSSALFLTSPTKPTQNFKIITWFLSSIAGKSRP
jgi:hypothetical protein